MTPSYAVKPLVWVQYPEWGGHYFVANEEPKIEGVHGLGNPQCEYKVIQHDDTSGGKFRAYLAAGSIFDFPLGRFDTPQEAKQRCQDHKADAVKSAIEAISKDVEWREGTYETQTIEATPI